MKRVAIVVSDETIELELDATAYVKWENRAQAARIPLALLLSLFLTAEVQRT